MVPPRAASVIALVGLALASGCLGGDAPPAVSPPGPASSLAFSGTLSGSPSSPGQASFPFEVARGADAVEAELEFPAGSDLFVSLRDPMGRESRSVPVADGLQRALALEKPVEGQWSARVGALRATDATFALEIAVHAHAPERTRETGRARIEPRDYLEVNALANAGASFDWSFDSTAAVTWDLHSHTEGSVVTHASGREATRENGTFTAPTRGLYSLFVLNEGRVATEVDWRVDGSLRVHSVS